MKTTFALAWIFIAVVSCIDTALTVHTQSTLQTMEENPIARAILHYSNWQPATFIGLKMAGTIATLATLALLYHFKYKHTLLVTGTIAAFQAALLGYLIY